MKKAKNLFIALLLLLFVKNTYSQTGSIKGIITDSLTGEELTGATIVVQGTTKGTIAGFDGSYMLDGLTEGTYNIIYDFISYDQQIVKCIVRPGETVTVNIGLSSASIGLDEVVVKKARRTSSEMALISDIKSKEGIVSGISAEQIQKGQDKDAAEIVRRVSGVTINNGRFVIVRGLNHRYNSVLLNGVVAPSFETGSRAFSLDILPSNMIENMMVFKSPAPELPADFAGAAINIVTKQNADKNELKLSYSAGYKENATFNHNFLASGNGKHLWHGFENSKHSLPQMVPSTNEFNSLYEWKNLTDYTSKMNQVIDISKGFGNNWATRSKAPIPDQGFSTGIQRRFTLGKASFGNITSLNYKYESSFTEARRTEYENYDQENKLITYDFDYSDIRSSQTSTIGLIHNWIMIFGKSQKIEFRNFFNNMGESFLSLRSGNYTYNSEDAKLINHRYRQRSIYSGQLAGKHGFGKGPAAVDWTLGYSTVGNNEPDNRIIKYAREINSNDPYIMKVDKEVNVFNGGRRYQTLMETTTSASVNLISGLFQNAGNLPVTLKAGAYYEKKHRDFNSRLFGIIAPRGTQALNVNLKLEPDELLVADNFFIDETNINRTGFAYKDGSRPSDSYQISNEITAAYLGLKIPLTKFADLYGGIRSERLNRLTYDFYEDISVGDSIDVSTDTLNIFPSANLTVKISDKHIIRFSYGKTVNHPEFRELSPAAYYDFDLNAIVHGNIELTDCYIDNFDARYEWYPNQGEMISIAGFYKFFYNPIELFLIPAGTGYDYKSFNTEKAYSKGLEIDVRKKLLFFENVPGPLFFLKDLSVVANASVIESNISTELPFAREAHRVMQGQSPYIVNLGVYYNNPKSGSRLNISYNKTGKRIAYAGTPSNPHTWELPRNSLDINLVKSLGKHAEINFGIKDLLNNNVRFVQYFGNDEKVELPTHEFKPNRRFAAGISVTF
ncbi:MAG: carboxypeptidase-like regulatory domain-containing protein [Bacteroidales bacterium]|nr:carboxypeptidase-like regulatory domain-containing protein [Bacteroidales bacterium]